MLGRHGGWCPPVIVLHFTLTHPWHVGDEWLLCEWSCPPASDWHCKKVLQDSFIWHYPPCVYSLSSWCHHTWPNLPGLPPSCLHTTNIHKLRCEQPGNEAINIACDGLLLDLYIPCKSGTCAISRLLKQSRNAEYACNCISEAGMHFRLCSLHCTFSSFGQIIPHMGKCILKCVKMGDRQELKQMSQL